MKLSYRQFFDATNSRKAALIAVLAGISLFSCATIPDPKYTPYSFPEGDVFVDTKPTRPFKVLGPVRVRVNYDSLNPDRNEQSLCRNAFNKGAKDLLKRAHRDLKGEAVIEVHSVVYYIDGKSEKFKTPECSDDGGEGQILMEGKAIRYLPDPKPSGEPAKG